MPRFTLTINGARREIDADADKPLLWVLRDDLDLKGTKYCCGVAECGACTVLLDGEPVRSCVTPVADAAGARVTTIEGLADHPVQKAWIAGEVPQCGYCQPAQILAAVALLADNPDPDDVDIDAAMGGILCRCGTYQRIRRAVHAVAEGRTR